MNKGILIGCGALFLSLWALITSHASQWPGFPRGPVQSLAISGNYAYASTESGFLVFNFTNPAELQVMGSYPRPADAFALTGNYAYVSGSADREIAVYDLSDKTRIRQIGSCPGTAKKIVIIGDTLYTETSRFDISNRAQPRLIGELPIPIVPGYYPPTASIAISGSYFYRAIANGLQIYALNDFTQPVGSFVQEYYPLYPPTVKNVEVSGSRAYVMYDFWVKILDVSNPAVPVLLGTINRSSAGGAVVGNKLYLLDGGGMQIVDVSDPAHPQYLARIGTQQLSGRALAIEGNNLMLYQDWIGLTVHNVNDPAQPALISSFQTAGHARRVAVNGTIAYLADDTAGLRILDVSNVNAPVKVGEYNLSEEPYSGTFDVVVQGNRAYLAQDVGGIRILDVSDPSRPTSLGVYPGRFWTLAVTNNYVFAPDAREFTGYITNALHVIDVSDPIHPQRIGHREYKISGNGNGIALKGNFAFVADGSAGLKVFDVSTPTNPHVVATVGLDVLGQPFAISIIGNLAYIADVGLKIFDISNPSNPLLLGGFDTFASSRFYAAHVSVAGQYAYMGCGHPATAERVLVLDVSNPQQPKQVARFHQSFSSNLPDTGTLVSGNRLYIAEGRNGLTISSSATLEPSSTNGFRLHNGGPISGEVQRATSVSGPWDNWMSITHPGGSLEITDTNSARPVFYRFVSP